MLATKESDKLLLHTFRTKQEAEAIIEREAALAPLLAHGSMLTVLQHRLRHLKTAVSDNGKSVQNQLHSVQAQLNALILHRAEALKHPSGIRSDPEVLPRLAKELQDLCMATNKAAEKEEVYVAYLQHQMNQLDHLQLVAEHELRVRSTMHSGRCYI